MKRPRLPDNWEGPYFEPRDIWWGIFWDHDFVLGGGGGLNVYICLVPCFPIRLCWRDQ